MRHHCLITHICVMNILIISSAFAQTSHNKAEKLPPIVVSASRVEQSPDKIGSSVTVITAEEIKKSGKHYVSEILETEVAGLSVSRNGGVGASTSVFIRGASSDYTKVYVDGILMNDPTSTGGGFDFGTLSTDNIEQIEILKGSQSVLYGSDAMGGVINITTKQGRAGKTNVNVGFEGGSFDTHKQTANINGANKTGTVRYALAASNFYTQGFSRAYHTPEDDFTRQQAVNGNLAFDVNDNVTLGVVGGYSNLRLNYDFSNYDANILGTEEKKYGKVFADIMTFDDRMEHQFSSTVTDINRFNHDRDYSSVYVYDGQTEDYSYQNNLSLRQNDVLTTGAEAKFSSGQGNGLGGEYEDEIYSGFANYVMDLGDLTLTAGTRYDDHSEFDGQWTYRFTSAYKIQATDTIIRASHGTGFKTPSLYQSNVDNFYTAPAMGLKAEKSKSFDLGVTQKITDKAEASVTGFYNKFDNMIDYTTLGATGCTSFGISPFCGQYQNINRATTKGIETTFKFQPIDILNLGANYTYMLGEDETTGTALLKRPKHVTSLSADVNVTDKVILGATSHYISRQNDFSGTTIKPYHVLDLRASYDWTQNATLYVRGENVLDNDYQPVYGYAGAGAAVYMGISLKN